MADTTVKQLATAVGISIEKLLTQLSDAGLTTKTPEESINDEEKRKLLAYLRRDHENKLSPSPSKITLRRRSTSEVRVEGNQGVAKTVSVEVRRKKTYIKQGAAKKPEMTETPEAEAAPIVAPGIAPEHDRIVAEDSQAISASTGDAPVADTVQPGESDDSLQVVESHEARADAIPSAQVSAQSQKEVAGLVEQISTDTGGFEEVIREPSSALAPENGESTSELQGSTEEKSAPADRSVSGKDKSPRKDSSPSTVQPSGDKRKAAKHGNVKSAARDQMESEAATGVPPRQKDKSVVNKRALLTEAVEELVEISTQEPEVLQVATAPPVQPPKRKKKSRARPSDARKNHVVRQIVVPETIAVTDLAQKLAVKAPVVIRKFLEMGQMITINQSVDQDTAILLVESMGHKAKPLIENALEQQIFKEIRASLDQNKPAPRPPIVTIMGHVDHGKTTLLDYIRRTRVAAKESGGITQHIGAYHVETEKGVVTFLDTPGHQAFTAMRARGAQVTDLVVLVVAADDGVMPQTIEAIQHAKAAGVPLVVAVNKIDRPEADPDRIKNELSQHEVIPEEWGGEHMFVDLSAKTGAGVEELLEGISLQAEIMELVAIDQGPAIGTVVESSLDRNRGPVATVLVKEGRLKLGDTVVCGHSHGRIRGMFDENGKSLGEAGPSIPVLILGLSETPNAGDDLLTINDERKARELAQFRQEQQRQKKMQGRQSSAAQLDDIFGLIKEDETQSLNLLLKTDVQGSAEALREALNDLSNDKVTIKLISVAVGGISESDIQLALASNAIVLGFNVRPDTIARQTIEENGVDARYYSIIYDLIEDIQRAIKGMTGPELHEKILGLAEVREVFRSSKFGAIAGCIVEEGTINRQKPVRVLRNQTVIYEGELDSLRRFKDDVNEVRSGTECGIGIKNYNDIKVGDQIEVYEQVEVH